MILTCDRNIIDIDFGIAIIEVVIQTIITTTFFFIFTTITPTFFLYVVCYWIWVNECGDFLIKILKANTTESIITIVITTCIVRFFSHSQQNFFSYDYINGHIFSLHWKCDCHPIKRKYWLCIAFKSSSLYRNGRILK